jgi:hypothetical protein
MKPRDGGLRKGPIGVETRSFQAVPANMTKRADALVASARMKRK